MKGLTNWRMMRYRTINMENKKGKNFSTNNASKKRKESDFYETPYSMTKQFLNHQSFYGKILEPACGNGAIVKVLQSEGYDVEYFDKEVDFLKYNGTIDNIVTNPPFSLAHEFILHAKKIATEKIAMLLPLSYLHGKRRYDEIYSDRLFPLSKVLVYTRYPLLGKPLREDGKYETGMMVYAWFVFDTEHIGDPTIDWIDNNEFILSKKDFTQN